MPLPLTIRAMRLSPFVRAPVVMAPVVMAPIVMAPVGMAPEMLSILATLPITATAPQFVDARIVAPAVTAATINRFSPAMLDVRLNPDLTQLIGVSVPPAPGYDRSAATRPIAEAVTVTDSTLFVSPDGARNWYLPHYRLRMLSAARYDIAVTIAQDGFRVAAGVDRKVPDGMTVPAGAEELPHTVEVWLTFTDGKGLLQSLVFPERLNDDVQRLTGFAAPLTLTQQRDDVVRSVHTGGATLMIRRIIQVAALLADPASGNVVIDQRLKLVRWSAMQKIEAVDLIQPRTRIRFAPDRGIRVGPSVFAPPERQPDPQPDPPPVRYHDVDLTLEQAIDPDPLLLDPQLHAYFAANAGGAATSAAQPLRRISVAWSGEATTRQHPYFQDSDDPALFYYLPDTYRLGRTARTLFVPDMQVRMTVPPQTATPGTAPVVMATIDYVARPLTNPARLEAARAALAPEIPTASRVAGTLPKLVPMPAKARLRMSVPGAAGVELKEYTDVTIDIANGFRQAMTVTLADFRQLFAAAFSDDATSLFAGEVLVDTQLPSPESVPVDIRFAHTVGPLLDSIETPGTGDAVAVKLRNCTESTLRITALPLHMVRGTAIVSGRAEGLDLSAPVELAPQKTLEFTAFPQTALDGVGAVDVVFDLDHVEVLAKPEQVLPVISDSSVPASYVREVKVMALPIAFAGQPAASPVVPPIELIYVEFETGDSVELTADARDGVGHIRLPLVNLLRNEDVRASYRFRQLVVYQNGDQISDADWRESTSDRLVVPMKAVS